MRNVQTIAQLRELVAARFPKAHAATRLPRPAVHFGEAKRTVGLEEFLETYLLRGGLTELVAPHPACGSSLVTLALLERARQNGDWLALVDAQDSFDPAPLPPEWLNRLLWVRCRNAAEALRAADLLLRDDNVPAAVLDLRLSPPAQLWKISASIWYRLQRLVEPRPCAVLALTPFALVGSAQFRFALEHRFTLDDVTRSPEELRAELKLELLRSHGVEHGAPEMLAEAG